jgi:hypothetical protein
MSAQASVGTFGTVAPILTRESRPALMPHAGIRMQQRGIRQEILECLLAYGQRAHDHHSCEVIYFDAKSIQRVQRELGLSAAHIVSDHREVYAVVDSNGCVVTTGHRYKRIPRDTSLSSYRFGRHRRPMRPRPPFVDLLSVAV